jgi:opacity protein-like surface antigen
MRIFFAALAFLALAAVPASAQGFYVSAAFGPNWDGDSSLPFVNEDTGLAGLVAVGAPIDGVAGLRVELEASFRSHDSTVFGFIPLEHDTTAVMVNAVYDAESLAIGRAVPYALVGAGVANTELTVGGIAPLTIENDGFAWQLGAGFNYRITDKIWAGVGYRYVEAPKAEVFGFELDGGSNHAVLANVTFAF